jgi:glyoxylase-like metal-dependent hydrolase (beta-lactamase superfamily II)
MTLLNRQWQPLDGTRQVRIYPYLRRPDVLSSNAYLFDTPDQIVLIDPGALAEQSEELLATVHMLLRERPRPLLIYLTHCHIDHALHTGQYHALIRDTPVWVAVHHEGAATLISGDPQRTASNLYNIEFPATSPDIVLLPPQVRRGTSRRNILLPNQVNIPVKTEELRTSIPVPFYRKTIPLGGEEFLEWYPTPGHTPESVCLRVGRFLFIGDILSAINPMVAGITGWNHQDFIHSASHVISLLEQTDIAWCCPGHGNVIPAPLVIDLLGKVRSQAEGMGEIEEMNTLRLHRTTEYALEALEETEEVFAALAGRLFMLAYHLENLEEEQLAQQYRQLLDTDKIDDCLQRLRMLADDLQTGQKLEVDFAIRAVAIYQKIGTLFDQEKLCEVIPPTLGNRAKSLLLDFINTAKGIRNPEEFVATDLNGLMEELLHDLRKSPHDDDRILDTADDEGEFLSALAARIAYVPLFEDVRITFAPGDSLPLVHLGAARIADTLADFLGFLAGRECREICLSTAWAEGQGEIRILCPGKDIRETAGEAKWKSFVRRFGMGGLTLSTREQLLCLRTRY